MTIAFTLTGPDNDSHMVGSTERVDHIPGLPICDMCGYRTDFLFSNPKLSVKRRVYDFSTTYDGAYIVSLKFKEYCARMKFEGLDFLPFEAEREFFHLGIKRVVPFDAVRRKTRFEKRCPKCGNFESIVGATPAFLRDVAGPLEGFYRTDLMFGSGNEKSPLVVVGLRTKLELEKERFRGLEFRPIEP